MADVPAGELSEEANLALAWTPLHARPATAALLMLDQRLAGILRQKREPMLAQIRLAWWRDRLGEPVDRWPRGDMALDALRAWRQPEPLSAVVDGWEVLLGEEFGEHAINAFAQGRARGFAALAHELGQGDSAAAALEAGRLWALADLAPNLASDDERAAVLAAARTIGPPPRLPRSLKTVAVLSGLGWRSVQRGGQPLLAGRLTAMAALRIGLFGR